MAIKYFGSGGSGNAQKIQNVDVSATPPTVGQVLKADAAGDWAPGVDSDSANAVTLQGRTLVATAPIDGDAIKWNANAPAGAGPGEWQPHPDNNSTDATHIQNIPVDTLAPTATKTTLVFDSTAAEYVAEFGAGIVSDGIRSYLKDPTENVGLGISSGMLGKLHAKTDVVADICKIITESDQGPAALHVRADTQGTQGGTGYGNIQIWNAGAPKVNIHYSPGTDEAIITADGTSNALKGLCLKSNGVSGQNLGNQKLGSNSFGQVADINNITGSDGNPMTTDVNAGTTINITSGNGDLLGKLAPGDMVSVNSGVNYAHVIDVVSNAQMLVSKPVGVGGSQNMKIQKSVLDARLNGGTVAMMLDATSQLAVGAGRMDPEGSLHVSDTNEAKAIVDSMGANALLELRANSETGAAAGPNRDTAIRFIEGTALAEKGRINYSADDSEMWIIADGRPLPTNGLILDNEGSLKARRVKQGDTIASILGTDGAPATTTAAAATNFFSSANCSANFDFAAVSEGDRIALINDPTNYETVVSAGATSFIITGGLGDGTSQTIKLEQCILAFVDEAGAPRLIIKDDGGIAMGDAISTPAGYPADDVIIQASQQGVAKGAIHSLTKNAQFDLISNSAGAAVGPDRDSTLAFSEGVGMGQKATISYTADYKQIALSLTDTPTVEDRITFQETPTGGRLGVRQRRGASGMSAKKLPDGQMLDFASAAVQATSDFSLTTHTLLGTNNPYQLMAIGDLVALSATTPTADEYVEITGMSTTYFQTGALIGASGVSQDVWLKPAHFRLEAATTTQTEFSIDADGRGRLGTWEAGYDSKLTVKGDVALNTFDTATQPAGYQSARIYYRGTNGGNDDKMRLLLHFDQEGPHQAWGDSAFGATRRHIVTSNGVIIDTTAGAAKFGNGAAKFDGSSSLIVDQMFGAQGDFYPVSPGQTWSMWMKLYPTPTSNIHALANVYGTATDYQSITYNQTTDTLSMQEDSGSGKITSWTCPNMGITSGVGAIGTGVWFTLVFVYEQSSSRIFPFVNGVPKTPGTVTTSWSNLWSTAAMSIGYDRGDSGAYAHMMLDEYAISSAVRHTTGYLAPTEPYYAKGLYCWHSDLSMPYRLDPVGA